LVVDRRCRRRCWSKKRASSNEKEAFLDKEFMVLLISFSKEVQPTNNKLLPLVCLVLRLATHILQIVNESLHVFTTTVWTWRNWFPFHSTSDFRVEILLSFNSFGNDFGNGKKSYEEIDF